MSEQITTPPDNSETFVNPYEGIELATVDAALVSMKIVHAYQMDPTSIEGLADKSDGSLLTKVDLASEAAAGARLHELFPTIPIFGEETGLSSEHLSPYMFMVDPIDGTRPFCAGAPTSTVMVSLYNTELRKLAATTTVEPATGRLWHSNGSQTIRTVFNPTTGEQIMEAAPCSVWGGSITDGATVLVDNFAAFDRQGRQITTNDNVIRLFIALQSQVAVQNYGSNGLHHALVANGGNKLAGAITTSMGGEWDVAGALLVLNAGGVAEGLRVNAGRSVTAADPLDPFTYDLLLSANSQASLDFLKQSVIDSLA